MRALTRLAAIAAGSVALTGAALFTPMTASATPAPAVNYSTQSEGTCEISSADLTWGVKESFRSYITNTIANGGWEVSDGATYETPSFSWHDGTGEFDPATGEGSVTFEGTITFNGHDGVLDLVFSNPTIEFRGDGSANLLLDARSNNAQGELVLEDEGVSVARVENIGDIDAASGSASISDAPTILTADGNKAFAEMYATGSELDPVNLTLTFASCEEASGNGAGNGGTDQPSETEQPTHEAGEGDEAPAENEGLDFAIWPIIAIAGAAFIVAFAVVFFVSARKNKKA